VHSTDRQLKRLVAADIVASVATKPLPNYAVAAVEALTVENVLAVDALEIAAPAIVVLAFAAPVVLAVVVAVHVVAAAAETDVESLDFEMDEVQCFEDDATVDETNSHGVIEVAYMSVAEISE
jgi:hypothetical protein